MKSKYKYWRQVYYLWQKDDKSLTLLIPNFFFYPSWFSLEGLGLIGLIKYPVSDILFLKGMGGGFLRLTNLFLE